MKAFVISATTTPKVDRFIRTTCVLRSLQNMFWWCVVYETY